MKLATRNLFARSVVVCLLVSLLIGITGLPMPVSKSTEERFPCEKCPCGCHTASHCWDKCCCHSDEEKLAWARANGVAPPVFLVQRVAASKRSQLASAKKTASEKTASEKAVPACCLAKKNASVSLSERSHGVVGKCSACNKSRPSKAVARSFKLVLLDPNLECHGSGKLWKLLQATCLVGNVRFKLELGDALPEFCHVESTHAPSAVLIPDGPVPKFL